MPDEKKSRRPGSVMGDDARATQPRPVHRPPPVVSPEIHGDVTPPPIVVDEVGRAVSRARSPSPYPQTKRPSMTLQEVVEELWPARHVTDQILEQLQRLVAVETRLGDLEKNGPAQVAAAQVAALRSELVGQDGDGGVVGHLAENVARDLRDHRSVVTAVDERATRADKFVRRVMYGAGSLVLGAVVSAVVLIYQAGEHAAASKAEAAAARAELNHKIDTLDESLTDLRGQVKLLLEARIRP